MTNIQIGSYCDGVQQSESAGGIFDVINPATGQVIAHEMMGDVATTDRIVKSSRQAFEGTTHC